MSLYMALKIIFYFTSICFVLGRPSIILEENTSRFSPPGANSHPQGANIPPYMIHLYQSLTRKSKGLHRPENQMLEESDTVQSLPAKNCTVKDNRWSLTFDLSPISRIEELRFVELRVHLPSFNTSSNITVEIYHTTKGQGKFFLGSITTHIPVKQHSSWKSFNVTKMMEQNLQWGNKLAIHADTHSVARPERDNVASHSENITNTDPASLHKSTAGQAIIVFFTKDRSSLKTRSPSLIKTMKINPKMMARLHRLKRTRTSKQQTNPGNTKSSQVEEQKPLCRKVDMVVDIKEIGWGNWIAYPKKYNAYQCEGTCHTPLNERSKTTNYDYIKSLVKDSQRVECSSCAPLKMRPMSVLLYDNNNLVLRHLEDMIIEDCGLNGTLN
ncbi:nodal homolog 3-A-like [Mixophyes fleayi]|uniref:nodal homolog 3-A-like n=1 Tax=Mixophyes fleayi TaxID=3061075 RepID=UPI003F4DD96A